MKRVLVLAAIILLTATACGGDDDGTVSSRGDERTIEIEMQDIAYSPDQVDVEVGETIRFVFENTGKVQHDAYIGDEAAQMDHEKEVMAADDEDDSGMDHGGVGEGDDGSITVEPGKTGELTYTFEAAGTVLIGCHEPGHYDAGMVVTVDVT